MKVNKTNIPEGGREELIWLVFILAAFTVAKPPIQWAREPCPASFFPLFCVQSDHPFPPPAILEMGGKRRRRVVHVPFDAASRRRFRIGGGEKKEE